MRTRLTTIGTVFLVMAIMLVGLTGCERRAEPRESDATAVVGTQEPGKSQEVPLPGETIVSAVTPVSDGTPVGESAQPTVPSSVVTSEAVVPTATPVSGSSVGQATAVPQPPASSGSGDYVTHTVQPGETLSSIARRYGTTWQEIASANSLSDPSQIYVGQKLKVPTSGGSTSGGTTPGCRVNHKVKPGEWVWQIARDYGVSPYDILAANGLTINSARTLYPGTVLCIP